jgi:hypothetical protein
MGILKETFYQKAKELALVREELEYCPMDENLINKEKSLILEVSKLYMDYLKHLASIKDVVGRKEYKKLLNEAYNIATKGVEYVN